MIMQSTALYPELDTCTLNGNMHEDERSLQIALELSNLGLLGINDDDPANYDDIAKGKKSQNMTECVPVPSSEHVAEIVGRQGKKILSGPTNLFLVKVLMLLKRSKGEKILYCFFCKVVLTVPHM